MKKGAILTVTIVISALMLSFIAFPLSATAQGPDSIPEKAQVVSALGKIPGRDLIVHVWVVVPPGADKNEAANEALRNQGARPFTPEEFSTISLFWNQFSDAVAGNDFVTQYYNPNNDPTEDVLGEPALLSTHSTWTAPTTSTFALSYGGTTDRCPSLVKECRGPQFFDGFNDVAWLELKGSNTLAVTWSGTSIDEADMALNLNFDWATDGVNHFDAETIFLHENGHVAGLGHSEIQQAVMYPSYQGVRQDLHQDDIDGITFLYPAVVDNSPTVSITTPLNGATVLGMVTVSADASDDKGVSQLEFFVDGVSIGVDTTSPYSMPWNTATGADGLRTVTATATDTIGQTASDSIGVTVDNTVPTVSITSPAEAATVLGTIDITASAADVTSGVFQVEFFVDGTSIGVDTTAPYSMSWDTTTVTNGNHALTANAVDSAGNIDTSTSVVVAVNNPTVTTAGVDSITYQLEGGKSDNKHLNIIVHVIDGLGSSVSDASVSITLKNIDTGGSWLGTGLTGSDGIVIFSLKNAAFGCYTTTVTDVTAAGLTWDNSTPANEFCKE